MPAHWCVEVNTGPWCAGPCLGICLEVESGCLLGRLCCVPAQLVSWPEVSPALEPVVCWVGPSLGADDPEHQPPGVFMQLNASQCLTRVCVLTLLSGVYRAST